MRGFANFIWAIDSLFFRSTMHAWRIRRSDERQLETLKAKQEQQLIVNFSPREPTLLDALCQLHGSDKGGGRLSQTNPYPWPPHSYTDFLSLLFEPFRHQVDLVFECGLGTNDVNIPSNMGSTGVPGASLRVWRDFFPNAEIIGADIDEKALFNEDRISTFAVDQTDKKSVHNMWDNVGRTGFQLMIDDGLHTFEAGSNLFLASIDHLALGGTYIIEDVKHDDMLQYMDFFAGRDFQVHFVSLRRPPLKDAATPIGDNQLVVIRHLQPKSFQIPGSEKT